MEIRVSRSNWRLERKGLEWGMRVWGFLLNLFQLQRDSEEIPAYCSQSQAEKSQGYQRREKASKIYKMQAMEEPGMKKCKGDNKIIKYNNNFFLFCLYIIFLL